MLSGKHRRTLEAIFQQPAPANIHYRDLEALFKALNADVDASRAGSRVAVALNGRKYSYHRPHPENEIGRKTVKDARDFLIQAGVTP